MPSNPINEEIIRDALRRVVDPELSINIVDLGLIYQIDVQGNNVRIAMTLTTPGCPMHQSLVLGAQRVLQGIAGIGAAAVDLVWDPPWTPARMSDVAKRRLDNR